METSAYGARTVEDDADKIVIVIKRPGEAPMRGTLPAKASEILGAAQAIVGGFIELQRLSPRENETLLIVFHEEARLASIPPPRNIALPHSRPGDILGTVFVATYDEDGNFASLSSTDVTRAIVILRELAF